MSTGLINCGHLFKVTFYSVSFKMKPKKFLPTSCSHQEHYVINACFKILIIFQMRRTNHDRIHFLQLLGSVLQTVFLLTTLSVLLHFEELF